MHNSQAGCVLSPVGHVSGGGRTGHAVEGALALNWLSHQG